MESKLYKEAQMPMHTLYHPRVFTKAWNTPVFYQKELSSDAIDRQKGIELWARLGKQMSSGKALANVIDTFGHSRKYWYRWRSRYTQYGPAGLETLSRCPHRKRTRQWSPSILERIRVIRDHPDTCRWGAKKIHYQLVKEGRDPPSAATVGRMIAFLKERGIIREPSRAHKRRKKSTRAHAQRYSRKVHTDMDRIQLDVDHYLQDGVKRCQFSAIHVPSRYAWGCSYASPSARNAKHFVKHILSNLPEGLTFDALQVDGGSEFRSLFEEYCQEQGIVLLVNRPRTPQQNAYIERFHRTVDEEFYQVRDIPDTCVEINEELEEWFELYNVHRPHCSLGLKTPCEWLAEHGTRGPPHVA